MAKNLIDIAVQEYRFVLDSKSHIFVYRHGKVWKDLTGDNGILALMQKYDTLRIESNRLCSELQEANEALELAQDKIAMLQKREEVDEELEILERYGWERECENPLEICHKESGDFASGIAARMVLTALREKMMQEDNAAEQEERAND